MVAMASSMLATLLLTVFTEQIGLAIVMPILPYLVADSMQNGIVLASFSAALTVGNIVWGSASDAIGRRRVILLGLIGTFGCSLGFVLTLALTGPGSFRTYALVASQTFGGFCGGTMTVAKAMAADISEPHKLPHNLGMFTVARGLALMVGPPLGAFLSLFGPSAPFLGNAGLALLNLLLAAFFVAESRSQDLNHGATPGQLRAPEAQTTTEVAAQKETETSPLLGSSSRQIAEPAFLILQTISFFCWVTCCFYQAVIAYCLLKFLGWGFIEHGLICSIGALSFCITAATLVEPCVGYFGERGTITFGLMLCAVVLFASSIESIFVLPGFVFVSAALYGAGTILASIQTQTFVARMASAVEAKGGRAAYGTHLGLNEAPISLAAIAGPVCGGMLYRIASIKVFMVCSAASLCGALIAYAFLPQSSSALHQKGLNQGV